VFEHVLPSSDPSHTFNIRFSLLSLLIILPAALGLGPYSASNRNEYHKDKIMFLGSRARPVIKAYKLTAICQSIF
jgi:hypothetical protein